MDCKEHRKMLARERFQGQLQLQRQLKLQLQLLQLLLQLLCLLLRPWGTRNRGCGRHLSHTDRKQRTRRSRAWVEAETLPPEWASLCEKKEWGREQRSMARRISMVGWRAAGLLLVAGTQHSTQRVSDSFSGLVDNLLAGDRRRGDAVAERREGEAREKPKKKKRTGKAQHQTIIIFLFSSFPSLFFVLSTIIMDGSNGCIFSS